MKLYGKILAVKKKIHTFAANLKNGFMPSEKKRIYV